MLAGLLLLLGVWNNPYPSEPINLNILYSTFSEQAKHLDPALSYASNEWMIINQIYEPPLQYRYLKQPYTLEPLMAQSMPNIELINESNDKIRLYNIKIKPGIYYSSHPAFAAYPNKTRECVASDFVYQIKRLQDPSINSPIFGFMQDKLKGAQVISKYHYQIKVAADYPQFIYWLAMPFFAPMPWEVIQFYNQVQFKNKNISIDSYPLGTGPFILSENNPNARMVLTKNIHYHGPLPQLDKVIFTLEKESIPYWNKFLQGYYDQSGISSDNFSQVLQMSGNAGLSLTPALKEKQIKLNTAILPNVFYWGFNMLDETVGGYSEKQRKLRQAISIAIDVEEYIDLFMNGRGVVAQGPLPSGIFGFVPNPAGMNPWIYDLDPKTHTIKRKSINFAKQLLIEAGYPNGIDPKTKLPLILYFDASTSGGADLNAIFAWTRKQFKKLNIDLVIRATQYNRFQEKMRTGNTQIFSWGWSADYPDPENFLFLLYGPNAKVNYHGENTANYKNIHYDRLFNQMKSLPNTPQRQAIINKMVEIARKDAPWIWGYNPLSYTLSHAWVGPFKTQAFSNNTLKYMSINPILREKKRQAWNQPKLWPFLLIFVFFMVISLPAIITYQRKMHKEGPP